MHKFSTKFLNTRKVRTSSSYDFICIWALSLSKISKSMLCIVWQNKFRNPCYFSNKLNELEHICSLLLQQVCISIEILFAFLTPNRLCTSFQPDYLSLAKVLLHLLFFIRVCPCFVQFWDNIFSLQFFFLMLCTPICICRSTLFPH